MNNLIIKTKLDDKYYKKYKYLFNYTSIKWNIINTYLLYNFIVSDDYKLCNYDLDKFKYHELYGNIFFNNIKYLGTHFLSQKSIKFQSYYNNYIIDKYENNKNTVLCIINNAIIEKNYTLLNKKKNIDFLLIYNDNFKFKYHNKNKPLIPNHPLINNKLFNKFYSAVYNDIYKQVLINLKNNENTDNIPIPTTKYKVITCHYDYMLGLSLSASYKMTLQIPHLIGTIAMSLKLIEKNGTLLLFWSILNVHIPVIKKLLALLAYGFKTIEIIDDDINQNLLVGVPEYYIKCSGYKDNISNDLITQLLEIAIDTLDNLYESCSILDYYEDYTEKNPNHTLFYNKQESENEQKIDKNKRLTKKKQIKLLKKELPLSSKSITPIYYIEDLNIPELDKIMNNPKIQFEFNTLSNKLEGIFVGFFQMVNNLIENTIAKDDKGIMYIKPEYILKRDITNITKLMNMFEYNKLPYNKYAVKVLLDKKNTVAENFYSLNKFINYKILNYSKNKIQSLYSRKKLSKKNINKSRTQSGTQSDTQLLLDDNKTEITDTESLSDTDTDLNIVANYYNRIKIALQVRGNLLNSSVIDRAPSNLRYNINDFGSGASNFINYKYKSLPLKIDMVFLKQWEILNTFRLIPDNSTSFNLLFLCEPSQQSIMACQYWIKHKCYMLKPENYHWYANTINPSHPSHSSTKKDTYKLYDNVYDLDMIIDKDNKDKWLWGDDNSGDITNVKNLKSIQKQIHDKLAPTKQKLDLIISNGNTNDKHNRSGEFINMKPNTSTHFTELDMQKMEISQVIAIISNSSIGGSCCVKHVIPTPNLYKNDKKGEKDSKNEKDSKDEKEQDNTMQLNWIFISYLYVYYMAFDSMSLYKPMSSISDNGEFYVICKDFKGVNKTMLNKLYSKLNKFKLNDTLIDKNTIPEAFVVQLNDFLTKMSDINVETIEKQNLVLTCFTSISDKVLNCNYFLNKNIVQSMLIPKYKEWINMFTFE